MRTLTLLTAVFAMAAVPATASDTKRDKAYNFKAEIIEACSCTMFCCCYFNTSPDGGMMCEFNNAVHVVKGNVGDVKLDGLKFWLSGDLGGDFTKGMKSAVLTFEPGTPKAQKDAVIEVLGKVYPVTWESFNMDEAAIVWEKRGNNYYARLADKGEVKLEGIMNGAKPVVINNLKYWGADRNDGFVLAYGTHKYKGFGHDYNHEKRNGFFITIESAGTIAAKK